MQVGHGQRRQPASFLPGPLEDSEMEELMIPTRTHSTHWGQKTHRDTSRGRSHFFLVIRESFSISVSVLEGPWCACLKQATTQGESRGKLSKSDKNTRDRPSTRSVHREANGASSPRVLRPSLFRLEPGASSAF